MPAVETKKRYRFLKHTSFDTYGTFRIGEMVDRDSGTPNKIPDEKLEALLKDDTLEYVDTVKWNPKGHGGRGAWEQVPEPEPAPEKVDDPKKQRPATAAGSNGSDQDDK